MALPIFTANGNFPPGTYSASLEEIDTLAFNEPRQKLLVQLKVVCGILKLAGCQRIYIAGSFASNKLFPGDIDLCWDDYMCDLVKLIDYEPLFQNTKGLSEKYGCDIYPTSHITGPSNENILDFFKKDRDGNPKGIIVVDL